MFLVTGELSCEAGSTSAEAKPLMPSGYASVADSVASDLRHPFRGQTVIRTMAPSPGVWSTLASNVSWSLAIRAAGDPMPKAKLLSAGRPRIAKASGRTCRRTELRAPGREPVE